MNKYELTVMMPAKSTPAKIKSFNESLEKRLTKLKGKILEDKKWGEIALSYEIEKNKSGVFLHFVLELDKQSVKKLEDFLKVEDAIVRHLLVSEEKH